MCAPQDGTLKTMLQGGTAEVKVAPAGEPDIQPAAPAAIEQSIVIGSGVAALSAAIYLADRKSVV